MLFYRMYKKIKSVLFYIKLLYNSTKFYYSTGRLKNGITTLKLIQNAKVGGVLENSGYLIRALRFSKLKKKWLRKWGLKLLTPPWTIDRIHSSQCAFLWCSVTYSWLVLDPKLAPCVARRFKEDNFVSLSWCVYP